MMMRPAGLFVIVTTLLTGCASMNYFNPADVRQGTWKQIRASGIARDASHTAFIDKVHVEGKTNHFSPQDERVTYWAHFTAGAFHSPYHVNFQTRWYDPEGNLFFDEAFPLNNMLNAFFMKTSLPIKDSPAQYFPGLWQVEIYYQGYLIDKKQFHIFPDNPAEYRAPKTAKQTSEQLSQLWEIGSGRRTAEEDTVFREQFERAQRLFHENKLGEAKLFLEEMLKKEPYRTEAHLGLAAVYYELEKWDEALAELDYEPILISIFCR